MRNSSQKWLLGTAVAVVGALGGGAWWLIDEPAAEEGTRAGATESGARPVAPPVASREDELFAPESDRTTVEPVRDAVTAAIPLEGRVVIQGCVRDAVSGAGLADATITARWLDGALLAIGESGPGGSYRLSLPAPLPPLVDLSCELEERELATRRLRRPVDAASLTVDFALRAGFTLSGRVFGDGRPLEFAELELTSTLAGHENASEDAVTDGDGRFRFEALTNLPRTDLQLVVVAEGFAPEILTTLAIPDERDELELDVHVVSSRTIRGFVVDARSGAPIEDADVESVGTIEAFGDGGDEVSTDERGRFAIEVADLPFSKSVLIVRADGYQPQRSVLLGDWHDGDVVRLGPTLVLTGRVTTRTGSAIDGADVRLLPAGFDLDVAEQHEESEATDEEGRFELEVVATPAGPCVLEATAEGFLPQTLEFELPSGDRAAAPFEFALEHAATIHGQLVAAPDGDPLRRTAVRLIFAGETAPLLALTRPDGHYEFEVDPALAAGAIVVVESGSPRVTSSPIGADELATGDVVRDLTLPAAIARPPRPRR